MSKTNNKRIYFKNNVLFLRRIFGAEYLYMKYLLYIPFCLLIILGCNDSKKPYSEQIVSDKPFSERITDLNKGIEDIRKTEEGKLINEGLDRLKYEYEIGKNDRYIITYIFDNKGCYEISFDGYFEKEEDVKKVLEGFTNELNLNDFDIPEEDNQLVRFKRKDKKITVEFDYQNSSKGIAKAIIFANE